MVDKVARLHFQPASPAGALRALSGWLIVFAIAVHNIPERVAIGVAAGYGLSLAFGVAAVSGLMKPIVTIVGAMMVSVSALVLPWGTAGCYRTTHRRATQESEGRPRGAPFACDIQGGEPDPRHLQETAVAAAFRP